MKTELERIRMACELRRRALAVDMTTCREDSYNFFRGQHQAMSEFFNKLLSMYEIDNYITTKMHKYMSDEELDKWRGNVNISDTKDEQGSQN